MKILFAYDGSDSANAAIAKAGELLDGTRGEAVVLSVWEPLTVAAIKAARFGGPVAVPPDAASEDERSEEQARELAEHGAEVARQHGFDARPLASADARAIADTIVQQAEELDADLIVVGRPGPCRRRSVPRQRLESRHPARPPRRPRDPATRRLRWSSG